MNTLASDLQTKPWTTLWAQRRLILIGAISGLILAVILILTLPKQWEARMVVGPAGRGAGADLSAFVPQAGSPALQYFLQRVNAVTAADFSVYETLMTGPRVAGALQKDEAFSNRLSHLCDDCATDAAALSRWLTSHVQSHSVGATQLRRVTVRLHDKSLGTDLLRALHRLSDETIRTDMRIRTDQRISYLRDQLGTVSNPDHRDALVGLLKEQERVRMMVGIDHDFAAEAVDPASIASKPAFPNPTTMIPVLLLLGALTGLLAGLYRSYKS